jgi:hypothetical protein
LVVNKWKSIIESGNSNKLGSIIDNNAVFFSPVVHTPLKGKKLVLKYLSAAVDVFKSTQFRYINEIIDKENMYGEFKATLDNIEVNGIDYIRWNNQLITEFKVFIRPHKGLEKIWLKMKNKLDKK